MPITIRLLCLDIRRRSRYTSAGASKIIIIEEIGNKSVIQRCAGITRLPVYREPVYRERTIYIYVFIIVIFLKCIILYINKNIMIIL